MAQKIPSTASSHFRWCMLTIRGLDYCHLMIRGLDYCLPMIRGLDHCLLMIGGLDHCLLMIRGLDHCFLMIRGLDYCLLMIRELDCCLHMIRGLDHCLLMIRGLDYCLLMICIRWLTYWRCPRSSRWRPRVSATCDPCRQQCQEGSEGTHKYCNVCCEKTFFKWTMNLIDVSIFSLEAI